MESTGQQAILEVETFLIKNGITKKKHKLKILECYALLEDITFDKEDVTIICEYIQENFKAFRNYFNSI